MVPKELTNEELLELEQEQKQKKEVREKETTGEEKKRGTPPPPRKFTVKVQQKVSQTSISSLKSLKM